jgi:hypothetical protein
MAGTLSLSSTVQVFPCPNCSETINTSVQQCPFCSAPIDRATAEQSAAATSRISQACSDASYLKIMLGIMIPFGLSILTPFLGLIGAGGPGLNHEKNWVPGAPYLDFEMWAFALRANRLPSTRQRFRKKESHLTNPRPQTPIKRDLATPPTLESRPNQPVY